MMWRRSTQHVHVTETRVQASETKLRGDEDEIDILSVSDESEEDANSPRAKHAKPVNTAQQGELSLTSQPS